MRNIVSDHTTQYEKVTNARGSLLNKLMHMDFLLLEPQYSTTISGPCNLPTRVTPV